MLILQNPLLHFPGQIEYSRCTVSQQMLDQTVAHHLTGRTIALIYKRWGIKLEWSTPSGPRNVIVERFMQSFGKALKTENLTDDRGKKNFEGSC